MRLELIFKSLNLNAQFFIRSSVLGLEKPLMSSNDVFFYLAKPLFYFHLEGVYSQLTLNVQIGFTFLDLAVGNILVWLLIL